MNKSPHRKAIVISALLTAFLLVTALGGLFLINRFTAAPADAAGVSQPAVVMTVQPAEAAPLLANPAMQQAAADPASNDVVIAAYQAQLTDAYTALQDAYQQIDLLQAGQSQSADDFEDDHDQGHDHDHNKDHEEHDDD